MMVQILSREKTANLQFRSWGDIESLIYWAGIIFFKKLKLKDYFKLFFCWLSHKISLLTFIKSHQGCNAFNNYLFYYQMARKGY